MAEFSIRPLSAQDQDWVAQLIQERWAAATVVVHGTVYQPSKLPGFAAIQAGQPAGLVTYQIEGRACEIVTLDSLECDIGIGTALVEAVREAARNAGCTRLWLVTTNDNLNALRFYQKRGLQLVAVHPDAVTEARKSKPEIPWTGNDGIPLRDEIELELRLNEPATDSEPD